jgi:hypothetical protein
MSVLYEIPSYLTRTVQDFVILYHPEDKTIAENVCKTVLDISQEKGLDISCCLYNEDDVIENISKFAVQTWLLVSENSIEDKITALHRDEALMRACKKMNGFVPVFTKPKDMFTDLAYGLMSYKGLTLKSANFERSIVRMFEAKSHKMMKENLTIEQNQRKTMRLQARCTTETNKKDYEVTNRKNNDVTTDEATRKFQITIDGKQINLGDKTDVEQRTNEKKNEASNTSLQSDISDNVLESLERARSLDSDECSDWRTYNIIINQPKVVNIK